VGAQNPQRTAGRHRRGRGGATACGTLTVGTFNVKRLLHRQGSSGAFSVKDSQLDVARTVCRASTKEITDRRVLSLLDLPRGKNHLWTPPSTLDGLWRPQGSPDTSARPHVVRSALSLPTTPSLKRLEPDNGPPSAELFPFH
jgi:hypothetical protein